MQRAFEKIFDQVHHDVGGEQHVHRLMVLDEPHADFLARRSAAHEPWQTGQVGLSFFVDLPDGHKVNPQLQASVQTFFDSEFKKLVPSKQSAFGLLMPRSVGIGHPINGGQLRVHFNVPAAKAQQILDAFADAHHLPRQPYRAGVELVKDSVGAALVRR